MVIGAFSAGGGQELVQGAIKAAEKSKAEARPTAEQASSALPNSGATPAAPAATPLARPTLSATALAAEAEANRAQLLTRKQSELDAHAAENKAAYDALEARRLALKPSDRAAIDKFNLDLVDYQAQRKAVAAEKAALEALRAGR